MNAVGTRAWRVARAAFALALVACATREENGSKGCSAPSAESCATRRPEIPLVQPPARTTAHPAGGRSQWFVLRGVNLGRPAPNASPDGCAWQTVGFDLDGRDTSLEESKNGTNTCHRVAGAPSAVLIDGPGGIDNAFGSHLLAGLISLNGDWCFGFGACEAGPVEHPEDVALAAGKNAFLLRIDDVGGDDDDSAPGVLFRAGDFAGGSPRFDGTDVYPVRADALVDGASLDRPRVVFPGGFITKGTWVGGTPGVHVDLPLQLIARADRPLVLPIDEAVLAVDLRSGVCTLGGAIDLASLGAAFEPFFELLGICPGNATYDQVIDTLTQSADLVAGAPSLQDVTRACDAMSVGVGLTMSAVSPPVAVVPVPPSPPVSCLGGDAGDAAAGDVGEVDGGGDTTSDDADVGGGDGDTTSDDAGADG